MTFKSFSLQLSPFPSVPYSLYLLHYSVFLIFLFIFTFFFLLNLFDLMFLSSQFYRYQFRFSIIFKHHYYSYYYPETKMLINYIFILILSLTVVICKTLESINVAMIILSPLYINRLSLILSSPSCHWLISFSWQLGNDLY